MIKIRHATIDDSQLIWEWRNDPVTRAQSRQSDPILWETHTKWYKEQLNKTPNVIYIGEENQSPIGVIRFDIKSSNSVEVNINLNPACRGKGFGKLFLNSAIEKIASDHSSITTIYATVNKENSISQRLFYACGFECVDSSTDWFEFKRART